MVTVHRIRSRLPREEAAKPLRAELPAREKKEREWSVQKPNHEFMWFVFDRCREKVKQTLGPGQFSLAVNDHIPPQLAFSWESINGDLTLIIPTHSKSKSEPTKSDFETIRKSISQEFENDLARALRKQKRVGYQFMHITKVDTEFTFKLSKHSSSILWNQIFVGEDFPLMHSATTRVWVNLSEIVIQTTSKGFSIKEHHTYRLPLNKISPLLKERILREKAFSRIVPHGHVYRVDNEILHARNPDHEHPSIRRIMQMHQGRSLALKCITCGSTMIGLPGEKSCALCSGEQKPSVPDNFDIEQNVFRVLPIFR